MASKETILSFPDIKSLLLENDKRAYEYMLNEGQDEYLQRFVETYSLIAAIVDAAADNEDTIIPSIESLEDDMKQKRILNEAAEIIDIQTDFSDRLALLEKRYLQARKIRIVRADTRPVFFGKL